MIVKFGAQCLYCNTVYEMRVDTDKPMTTGECGPDAAQVACCPQCKKHPVMFLITHYHFEVTPVKKLNWDDKILITGPVEKARI